MRGYFRKRMLILLLALAFVLPIIPVGATQATRDQLREIERQREEARQQLHEQQQLLAGTEFEMSEVMLQIMELDQQMMDANFVLEMIGLDLLSTELRLLAAEDDLAEARAERELQQEILRERVRFMHEQGETGWLEIILQAESLTDFFARWEYIRKVAQFDRDLLERLEATEERIASNVELLNTNRMLILELQAQEQLALLEVEKRMDERAEFFAALYLDAERQAEFLAILEEQEFELNLQYGIVQERYRQEVAEEARRRREEEDRRRREAAEAAEAARRAQLATLNSFDDFAWPLAVTGTLTSPFGNRPDPFTGRNAWHSGTDVAAPGGTHIFAMEAGYVRFAGWNAGLGNFIIIDHADGYSTLYAHNNRNRVTTGQRVRRGQHIGDVGTTGRSTGNHLHFEVRINGTHVNPMRYFGG